MLHNVSAASLSTVCDIAANPAIPAPGEFIWCSVFSPRLADGNRSMVIRLNSWPEKKQLEALAGFIGDTETSFVVLKGNRLEVRWFAGKREVPLCGHCALAVNSVLLPLLKDGELLEVANLSGRLWLSRHENKPYLVFKDVPLIEIPTEAVQTGMRLIKAFDAGRDYLLIVEDEETLKAFNPTKARLERLAKIGCIISSPSRSSTAAFRFFAPRAGIHEDRASGSVIPALMRYWAPEQCGEHIFSQESGYGIKIGARWLGERVALTGDVMQFARGMVASTLLEDFSESALTA
jgi:predicted PhzF superfamily epimerase YddE/YHI9